MYIHNCTKSSEHNFELKSPSMYISERNITIYTKTIHRTKEYSIYKNKLSGYNISLINIQISAYTKGLGISLYRPYQHENQYNVQ